MHSRTILSSVTLACALVLTGWASSAAAQSSCEKNEDCETGYFCIKGASSPGCDAGPGSECTPQDATVDEVGYCEKGPTQCTKDEECGEYLTCSRSDSGVCWTGPEGEGCSEPDPDAPSYCGYTMASCEVSEDCPREFECVESTLQPDCLDCEATTVRECQPRTITCENSAECPSDWSCFFNSSSGGGDCAAPAPRDPGAPDSGNGSGSSDVPESPVDDGALQPDCTPAPVQTVGQCLPNQLAEFVGWDSRGDAETSNGAPGGAPLPPTSKGPTNDANESSSSAESDSGGCSVAALGASSGSWMTSLLWLAPLALGITRRRRAR